MASQRPTFASDFRRFFGRGLAILLPSILTLWILWYALAFVYHNVAVPINRGLRWAVIHAAPAVLPAQPEHQPEWFHVTPEERDEFLRTREGLALRSAPAARLDSEIRIRKLREYWDSRWYLSAAGLIVAIVLIYLAGLLLGGLIGRRVYAAIEAFLSRLPGFKQVYPHMKQLVNLVIGERTIAFKRVVLVEYPRKGLWSLGLVTSPSMRAVAEQAGEPSLAIFVPSTPTFTGVTINVPQAEVIDLPISIDEAIRFVLTGGVLIPEGQTGPPPAPALTGPRPERTA